MRMSVAGDTPSRSRKSAAGKTPRFSSLKASLDMKRLYTSVRIYFMLYFKTVSTTYAIICQMIRETIRETILRYIKVYLQSGAGIELQVLPGHRPRPYCGHY